MTSSTRSSSSSTPPSNRIVSASTSSSSNQNSKLKGCSRPSLPATGGYMRSVPKVSPPFPSHRPAGESPVSPGSPSSKWKVPGSAERTVSGPRADTCASVDGPGPRPMSSPARSTTARPRPCSSSKAATRSMMSVSLSGGFSSTWACSSSSDGPLGWLPRTSWTGWLVQPRTPRPARDRSSKSRWVW